MICYLLVELQLLLGASFGVDQFAFITQRNCMSEEIYCWGESTVGWMTKNAKGRVMGCT